MKALAVLTLVSALVLPVAAAYVAAYGVLAGALLFLVRQAVLERAALRTPATAPLAAALLLSLAATLLAGPRTGLDWLFPAVFAAPLLALGFAGLGPVAPRLTTPTMLAGLALVGTALGLAGGIAEFLATGTSRVGVFNNPIHYAGLMVGLGFAALSGLETARGRWRYLFVFGPAMAAAGAFLSGSRGPFLAVAVLGLVLAGPLIVWNRRDRGFMLTLAAAAAVAAAAFAVSPLGPRALLGVVELVQSVLSGDSTALDLSRAQMLEGGAAAFRESPLWGHGLGRMMAAAEAHYPADSPYLGYDNLHSDLANMAASGGLLGLLAYGLVLAAPLSIAVRARANRRAALIVALSATLGYAVLGLTNAMFGVLPQMMLHVTLTGWLLLLTRPDRGPGGGVTAP